MFGGVSDYTYHFSNALSKRTDQVYVLTTNKNNINNKDLSVKVMPVIDKWNLLSLPQIISNTKKINPDVISLQFVPYMYNRLGIPFHISILVMVLRFYGYRLITTFHETYTGNKSYKNFIIYVLQKVIIYIICVFSNRIVVSTAPYRESIGLFRNKISIIPVGSNILPYHISTEEKIEFRENLGICDKFIIGTFGTDLKRCDLLIYALAQLKKNNYKPALLVLGKYTNKSEQELLNMIYAQNLEKDVIIPGYLEEQELFHYLSIIDLYIQLDDVDFEGMGGISIKNTTVAAAYAAGLPIVGTKGHMTDKFFKHSQNVYLISNPDNETVYNAIKNLIDDPILMNRIREGSVKTYESKLKWDVIANEYLILNGLKSQNFSM